jgi:hypothetical protein
MMKKKIKIGFIIQRKMYFKFLGPVINILLKKNFDIYILFNYSQSRNFGKWRDFPFLDTFFSEKNIKKRIFFKNDELLKIIKKNKLKIIGSLLPFNKFNIDKNQKKNFKWILFQHGIDLFWNVKELKYSDYIFLYSNYWRNLLINFLKQQKVKYNKNNLVILGNPQFDMLEKLDDTKIKNKYNLPINKKIILFLPLGQPNTYSFNNKLNSFFAKFFFIYPNLDSIFFWLRKEIYIFLSYFINNEISVLRKIKKFSKKNGYYLIIKSRSKRVLGSEFEYYSDRIFYDEQLIPSTIMELMKISNNVISYITTASGEAVFNKSYHYTIFDKTFSMIQNKYLRSFDKDYFSFNGVNEIISSNNINDLLLKKNLKTINIKKRKIYLKKYFECFSNKKINLPNFLNKI